MCLPSNFFAVKIVKIHISRDFSMYPSGYKLITDMVGSAKTWKFLSTKFYQINRGNHHLNKQKLCCFDDAITHQNGCRLIDGWFHKNLVIHVSSGLLNKQKYSALKLTKIFLFWWHHHAKGINKIIESQMVATKTLNFMSAAVFRNRRN